MDLFSIIFIGGIAFLLYVGKNEDDLEKELDEEIDNLLTPS
jgi:hypothetical protein